MCSFKPWEGLAICGAKAVLLHSSVILRTWVLLQSPGINPFSFCFDSRHKNKIFPLKIVCKRRLSRGRYILNSLQMADISPRSSPLRDISSNELYRLHFTLTILTFCQVFAQQWLFVYDSNKGHIGGFAAL